MQFDPSRSRCRFCADAPKLDDKEAGARKLICSKLDTLVFAVSEPEMSNYTVVCRMASEADEANNFN